VDFSIFIPPSPLICLDIQAFEGAQVSLRTCLPFSLIPPPTRSPLRGLGAGSGIVGFPTPRSDLLAFDASMFFSRTNKSVSSFNVLSLLIA